MSASKKEGMRERRWESSCICSRGGRSRRSSSMLLGERTICVGRAGSLCNGTGIAAETNNEMDNGVLFSQERTNKVVFIHPFMLPLELGRLEMRH
jgi:hypothetical protein